MKEKPIAVDVMVRRGRTKATADEVEAVFPNEQWAVDGMVTVFDPMGGHCGATWAYILTRTRPATPEQCEAMLKQLRQIGYAPRLIHRRNYRKGTR